MTLFAASDEILVLPKCLGMIDDKMKYADPSFVSALKIKLLPAITQSVNSLSLQKQ